MATDFDVITYANGAFLYDVFNGVAAIFGNSSYSAAMATCMTAASIGIMISAVLQGKMVNLLWMIQAIFLYMAIVLPKVSVNIVDKTEIEISVASGGGIPSVRRVDNVPIGMAIVASSVSTFSSWSTDAFETVFSLPNSIKYTANGPLFGQNLVMKMLDYRPNDASLANNLQEFWKNCVFYDIGLGFYSFDELSKQTDIMSFLKTNTAMTRGFYRESGGSKAFIDCRAGATALEADMIENQKDFQFNSGNEANVTMPTTNGMASSGWTAMPVAFAYLSNVSKTSSQLLIQSAMMNSMDSGLQSLAGNVDADAAIQGYALARAERERETTFGVMGKMAAEMLPILKNLMEGLMYAIFPFVGLAILFPNGWKAFGYYAKMLLWIGLWPVAFALLHYAMTFFGSFAIQKAAAYWVGSHYHPAEYNIYSQMGLKEVMKKYEAIAGYMMTMIPMVTYVMVAQGGAMMAGMVGRIMDGYAKPAESAAMEASAGNFSVGNTSFENQSAFQHMSAPTQIAGFGQTNNGLQQTTHAQGATVTQFAQSNLPISASKLEEMGSRQQSEYAKSLEHTQETGAALAKATQATMRQMQSNGSSLNNSHVTGTNAGHTEGSTTQDAAAHINQAARDWVKQNSHSDATLRKLSADWKVGASVDSQNQFIGKVAALLTGAKVDASASVSGGVSGTTTNSDMQQLSQRFATSETLQHTLSKLASDQIATLNNQSTTGSQEQREALEKSLASMNTASDQHSTALRESERLGQSVADFKAASVSTNTPLVGQINKQIMGEMGSERRYNAVAALERGDMGDKDLQAMQKIITDVVVAQHTPSVDTQNHEKNIREAANDDKQKIQSQQPTTLPSNGTMKAVNDQENKVEAGIAITGGAVEKVMVDIKDKQDSVLKTGTDTIQDVMNETQSITPDVRHADSGSTVAGNVFNDLVDKTKMIGVDKK